MTVPTARRAAALATASAVLVGLAVAVPQAASAAAPTDATNFAFIETSDASQPGPLRQVAGLAPAAVTDATDLTSGNLSTRFFDASSGTTTTATTTVATSVRTAGGTQALVVTNNGTSRIVSTYNDANPVVSANGDTVWFVVHGNLFKYTVATQTTTQISTGAEFNPWAAAPGSHSYLYRLAVSPNGLEAAVLQQSYPDSGSIGVNRSQIKVFDISQTGASFDSTPLWTSYNYVGNGASDPQLLPYNLVFTDDDTLVFGECVNDPCATWTTFSVTPSSAQSGVQSGTGITALPNLDNLLGLKQSGGTWYAWSLTLDSGNTITNITPYSTTDNTFSTALTAGTMWPTGSGKWFSQITPLQAEPPVVGTVANKLPVTAAFAVSKTRIFAGRTVGYTASGTYKTGLAQDVSTVAGALWKSIDGGKTWVKVVDPAAASGTTPRIWRNTYFQWRYAGDDLVAPSTSATRLVQAVPSLSFTVKRWGIYRIVTGKTGRVGGSVSMWKKVGTRWYRIHTTSVKAHGLFNFGRQRLGKGLYKVTTSIDRSWASNFKAFRV